MYFFYNVLFITVLIVASPFLIFKLLTKEKHRKGFREKLGLLPPRLKKRASSEVRIHVHAVSVGEVIAVTPFIKEFKKRHPDISIVLSTVTPTGNEMAHQRLPEADYIIYFPYDLPWVVKRVIDAVKPRLYICVETELWPNILRTIKLFGAGSIIINGRISPRSFKGYSLLKPLMKRVLANIDTCCMQSSEDARRIRLIGARDNTVLVTGNMKYDQRFIEMDKDSVLSKMRLFGISSGDRVIIAGSTHRGEDEIVIQAYKECLGGSKNIRLIIVPRHTERSGDIEQLIRVTGLDSIRRTAFKNPDKNDIPYQTVIIVDTIGELSALYSLATVVLIGGSFIPHGGQNPLEAMYYKKPVIFGMHMFNFQEITEEILANGAGVRVENPADLTSTINELINDTGRQTEMGEKGYKIIMKNRGAVERNIAAAERLLSMFQ